MTAQTQQILAEIDRLLALAGSDKSRILQATIYLANIGSFAEMNAAWDAWVPAGNTPARATVEARREPSSLTGRPYPCAGAAGPGRPAAGRQTCSRSGSRTYSVSGTRR